MVSLKSPKLTTVIMTSQRVPPITDRFLKALPNVGLFTVLLNLLVCGLLSPRAAFGQSTLASRPVDMTEGETLSANQTASVSGQQAPVVPPVTKVPELGKRISVDLRGVTLEDAIKNISAQMDFRIAYLREAISGSKKVTIEDGAISAKEALTRVLEGTNLRIVRAAEKQLVLVDRVTPTKSQVNTAPQGLEEMSPIGVQKLGTERRVLRQQGTIAGTVTEGATGDPLPGVNVVVEGTQQGASTAPDGTYEITGVEAGTHTLRASFVGYADAIEEGVQVEANQTTTVDFELQQAAADLNELVVVGYNEQERVSITGAVSSVSDAELEEINTVNATQLLQGQLSGVYTKQTSGQPGAEGISFNIRGFGNPLVLVDGVERDLSDVSPESIESISVLKDASAAVYGARAGNGVIMVTTKRGGFDQPLEISYEGSYSAQEFTNKPNIITDAGSYLELYTEAERNAGLTPTYSEETIKNYKSGAEGYESYNWFDYAFKDYSIRSKHTLSFTGGSENIKYYASAGFNNKGGMISSDDWNYERYNLRANLDGRITDMITASMDLNYVNEGQSEARSQMWRGVYKSQPMAPTNFPDTSLIPASNLTGTPDLPHPLYVG